MTKIKSELIKETGRMAWWVSLTICEIEDWDQSPLHEKHHAEVIKDTWRGSWLEVIDHQIWWHTLMRFLWDLFWVSTVGLMKRVWKHGYVAQAWRWVMWFVQASWMDGWARQVSRPDQETKRRKRSRPFDSMILHWLWSFEFESDDWDCSSISIQSQSTDAVDGTVNMRGGELNFDAWS